MKLSKICTWCEKEKNMIEYSRVLGHTLNECKECRSNYARDMSYSNIFGIDFEVFIKWIEFQFDEGMTMQNYGSVWRLDHVLPISSFNLLDGEELVKAMDWKNIRPLLLVTSMQKADKIDPWLYLMQEVKADYFCRTFRNGYGSRNIK
jgi:hypothetical protein